MGSHGSLSHRRRDALGSGALAQSAGLATPATACFSVWLTTKHTTSRAGMAAVAPVLGFRSDACPLRPHLPRVTAAQDDRLAVPQRLGAGEERAWTPVAQNLQGPDSVSMVVDLPPRGAAAGRPCATSERAGDATCPHTGSTVWLNSIHGRIR